MRAARKENVLVRPDCIACEMPIRGPLFGVGENDWVCQKCYLKADNNEVPL